MTKLKMGMVGGGIGAFIGEVHRKAARMDGGVVVTAGAFDINPARIVFVVFGSLRVRKMVVAHGLAV